MSDRIEQVLNRQKRLFVSNLAVLLSVASLSAWAAALLAG